MWEQITRLFAPRPAFRPGPPAPPRLILTEPSVAALQSCMEPEIRQGQEGIAYLLGQSDGTTTLIAAAIRPQARTTRGSFAVASPAMAQIVRAAVSLGLQVAGQVHTHPGKAYHSAGDEKGARIAYRGYVSIVLPDYGRRLPALDGAAAYMFRTGSSFVPVDSDRITIVPGQVS